MVAYCAFVGGDYPRPIYMKAAIGGEAASVPQFEVGSDEAKVIVSVTYELR